MDISSSPTPKDQSFSPIAGNSSPQGDKKIVAPISLHGHKITVDPSNQSAIDHTKSAEKFNQSKHSESDQISPVSMKQSPSSSPTPNNVMTLRRGIKWADEYGKNLAEVKIFTPESDDKDDSASAEITEIDSHLPIFSLKVLDAKISELLQQKQASNSSQIMKDDKKIYTFIRPEASPIGPTFEEARVMRNAFREVATWAASKNNETLNEFDNAKAALKLAKKYDAANVPPLKAWVNIASARREAAEKYATWTEARHKASLAKVWIEPGVPKASENIANEWANQWDPKRYEAWRIVNAGEETGITKNWTPDEITKNWDLAKDAIWAKDDPTYAEIKRIAADYAILQFAEDKKNQPEQPRFSIDDGKYEMPY